ncbi:MAG: DUF1043 family protein [Gammaproteobacteria bacterium]
MSDATVTLMWTVALITLAVGIAAGFVIAYWLVLKNKRADQLQQDLERHQREFHEYRDHVDEHFLQTSELFQDMTRQYRALYEHLATGAQSLCSDRLVTNRLNVPDSGPMVEHKPGVGVDSEPAGAGAGEPSAAQSAADVPETAEPAAGRTGGQPPATEPAEEQAAPVPESLGEHHTAQKDTAEAALAPEPTPGAAAETPAGAQAGASLSEEEQEMESLAPRPPTPGVGAEPAAAGSTDAASGAEAETPKHRLH